MLNGKWSVEPDKRMNTNKRVVPAKRTKFKIVLINFMAAEYSLEERYQNKGASEKTTKDARAKRRVSISCFSDKMQLRNRRGGSAALDVAGGELRD